MKDEFEAMEEYWRERAETERMFYEDQIEKSKMVVSDHSIKFLIK